MGSDRLSTVKKIPMRKCTGCNEMKEKKAMMRVLKCEEGIVLDTTGKKNGRGAYLCKSAECLSMANSPLTVFPALVAIPIIEKTLFMNFAKLLF